MKTIIPVKSTFKKLIAWLRNTSKALPVPLYTPYGTASNAILWHCGLPPYVNYQAINRLKHGFSCHMGYNGTRIHVLTYT